MSNDFFQAAPALTNQYQSDRLLRSYLKRALPSAHLAQAEKELDRLGARAAGDLLGWAEEAERNPPEHISFDAWGRRLDEIRVHAAWEKLAAAAAEEGIVATAYERKFGAHSRLVQFAKLYLYHPSSAFFSCPLAMTDGAARALELFGSEDLKKRAFTRLTSRDPATFWTSGQWMTERTGGSDVSGTSTVARPLGGDRYELHGTKWFTSATTSPMAMTLARIEGHPEGSRGLSLFYLELRDQEGRLRCTG
jgi:putative acyl-CoA dehydrogenase